MIYDKGPVTAVNVLASGIVELAISPILFVLRYIAKAILLPFNFLSAFFDLSTP